MRNRQRQQRLDNFACVKYAKERDKRLSRSFCLSGLIFGPLARRDAPVAGAVRRVNGHVLRDAYLAG